MVTSRGMGKTWSVAMFCAVMMICIPGIQITVFAVGQYTANKMVTLTKQFLQRHPEGRELLGGRQSAESVVLQGPGGYLDKRLMEARPSQSTVARTWRAPADRQPAV